MRLKKRRDIQNIKRILVLLGMVSIICSLFQYSYNSYIKKLKQDSIQLQVYMDEVSILDSSKENYEMSMSEVLDRLLRFYSKRDINATEFQKIKMRISRKTDSLLLIHKDLYMALKSDHDQINEEIGEHTKLIDFVNIFILICIFMMLFLLFGMVNELGATRESEKMKERMNEQLITIIERDRHLISCELHDDLAQKLSQINRYFENPQNDSESFSLLKKYSRDVIHQIRILSNRLKSPYKDNLRFDETFNNLFSDFKVLTNLNLDYTLIGVKNLKLDEDKTVHIYRIVQELLNNALKHSKAENVNLNIIYSHPEILLKYFDNGLGYDPSKVKSKGQGLNSIRFRMEILGASWVTENTMSGGVHLCIKVPV